MIRHQWRGFNQKGNLMKTFLLTALLLSCSLSAGAAPMYVCTDAKGNKTYTQNPSARCQAINLGKPSVYSSANPSYSADTSNTSYSATNESTPTPMPETAPTAAPSVVTLGESDQIVALRRKLEQAKKAVAEGKKVRYGNERNYAKYLERIAGLEKAVKDIEAELEKAQSMSGGL